MEQFMQLQYRYYATVDRDGSITDAYSTVFRSPSEGDICIDSDAPDGHLTLFGETNPPLHTELGVYRYRWDGEQVILRSQDEIDSDQEAAKIQSLPILRTAHIAESKILLAEYLDSNPLPSAAHGGETAYYTVTAEKQALLTSALMMAQGAMQAGIPYEITWNAAGQACEIWTMPELMQLAFEIAAYIKPFVAHQQKLEVLINACDTPDELEATIIDYSKI